MMWKILRAIYTLITPVVVFIMWSIYREKDKTVSGTNKEIKDTEKEVSKDVDDKSLSQLVDAANERHGVRSTGSDSKEK